MADSVNDEAARLIAAASRRDGEAAARLLLLVYEELRKLAHCRLAQEPPGSALQTIELVHEAYLRLFEDQPADWSGTGHSNAFSAIVSTSPRSVRFTVLGFAGASSRMTRAASGNGTRLRSYGR